MKLWNNPLWVSKTPILTSVLLEYANLGQVFRMWTERTAAGQNVWSWLAVNIALMLFINFYRVCCPKEKFAFWATVIGVCLNWTVIISIIYFRYIATT